MLWDSWNNAKMCLNYGDFSFNTFEEKEDCGYMDNSPLHSELPTDPQFYYYYF
jgi:hypothetical protein